MKYVYNDRNWIGKKFNKLLIIAEHHRAKTGKTGGYHRWYTCLCDCGNTCVVIDSHIKSGATKSCGCFKKVRMSEGGRMNLKYDDTEAFIRKHYSTTKHSAKKRGILFEIPFEDFRKIVIGNCSYCGQTPNQLKKEYSRKSYKTPILLNGVDRVDNNKGYTTDNCVTACFVCNYAKLDMTLEEFKSWINKVYFNMGLNK